MCGILRRGEFPGYALGTLGALGWLCILVVAVPVTAGVSIHVLDVGQGDATVIQSSSGMTLLFDGGENGLGASIIVPYLTSLGVDELDYMAASHYHSDHIGGLDEVFAQKGVSEAVYDRGWNYSSTAYNSYAFAVASKRVPITDGQIIDLGDGVTVTCLAVNGNGVIDPPFNDLERENDYCVALLVECGDFDYIQAGDLPGITNSEYTDIETSLAPEVVDGLEVLHVNHHGSYSSTNTAFMNFTRPEVAVISVGNGNPYGHPFQSVLNRLTAYGTFVYQTEAGSGGTLPPEYLTVVDGHIVITTDGYGDYFVNADQWAMDEDDPTAVASAPGFALLGNYPNPFNPVTSIMFSTPTGGPSRLTVYDLSGRRVLERDFVAAPGQQNLLWDGKSSSGGQVPSGVYVYRIATPGGLGTGRMSLVK
jgi:beta-lactamase superfamily II metal-dependent hydrolase